MLRLFGSLAGAVLPEPQRSDVERRFGGDPALTSFVLGVVEFLAGTRWLYESAMRELGAMADQIATGYLAVAERRTPDASETLGFTWGGMMLWVFWLLHPLTWLLISIPLVGLLRVAAFLTTRQAVAEPIAWLLVRLVTFGAARVERAQELAQFGAADEPDVVEAGEGGELFVFTPRRRPEWIEAATIEVAERYYRPVHVEPVERGGRKRYRYRLAPAGEHDVIRRLVRYELPKTGIRWPKPRAVEPAEAEASAPTR